MAEANENPLAAEILAEKASAYFATVRRMQSALAALAAHDARRAHDSPDGEYQRHRDDLLAEAAEQAWFFIIQREAMKLPYYEEIFVDFDIPEEVRKKMGPKKGTGAWR